MKHHGLVVGTVKGQQVGQHNMYNALGVIIAVRHAGVPPMLACEALSRFSGVKRRMELIYTSLNHAVRITQRLLLVLYLRGVLIQIENYV
ncbi:MAG: hypothetical protein HAW62_04665 [Endozoicomonadaceae bacterium]|nr:hypothetical protein [Endozoicomonadaceae bacterium]